MLLVALKKEIILENNELEKISKYIWAFTYKYKFWNNYNKYNFEIILVALQFKSL